MWCYFDDILGYCQGRPHPKRWWSNPPLWVLSWVDDTAGKMTEHLIKDGNYIENEWLWYLWYFVFVCVCVSICFIYDMHNIGMCLFLHLDLTNSKFGFHPCMVVIFSRPEVVCLWDHLALVRPSWPRSAEDMVRSKNPRKHVSVLYNYCRWFGHSWPEDVNYIF